MTVFRPLKAQVIFTEIQTAIEGFRPDAFGEIVVDAQISAKGK